MVRTVNSATLPSDRKRLGGAGEECIGTECPIAVVFLNDSSKTYIEIEVSARLPGRSNDATAKSDLIVEPKSCGWKEII